MRLRLATVAVLMLAVACSPAPSAVGDSATSSHSSAAVAGAVRPVVVLDPGHNGGNGANPETINQPVPNGRGGFKACNTVGAATDAGYPEHAFNWDVALRVRTILRASDIEVFLTRPDDTGVGPCVNERAAIGNRAQADAVVSIHADGGPPDGRGFRVIYSDPPLNEAQGAPSVALATTLRNSLRDAGFPPADYIGTDGLNGRDDLAGLNHSERPAVLVECGNMRNSTEAAGISSSEGRARYATAIADGIMRWLADR